MRALVDAAQQSSLNSSLSSIEKYYSRFFLFSFFQFISSKISSVCHWLTTLPRPQLSHQRSRIRKKSYHIRKNSSDLKNFMDRGLESPFSKKRSISVRAPASPRSLARDSEAVNARTKRAHAMDDIFAYEDDSDNHVTELDRERSVAASAPANTSPIALERRRREEEREREKKEQKERKRAAKQEKELARQRDGTRRVERVHDIERARSLTLSTFNFEARLEATKKQVDEEIVQLLRGIRRHQAFLIAGNVVLVHDAHQRCIAGIRSKEYETDKHRTVKENLDRVMEIAERILAMTLDELKEGGKCMYVIEDIQSIIHSSYGGTRSSLLAVPLELFDIYVRSPVRGTYREQEVGPATTLPVLPMLAYGRTPLSHAERVLRVLRAQSTPRLPASLVHLCHGRDSSFMSQCLRVCVVNRMWTVRTSPSVKPHSCPCAHCWPVPWGARSRSW